MKERPIIFTGESVRAILAGRKTQTRRLVREPLASSLTSGGWPNVPPLEIAYVAQRCPYEPGGRLWVRETWQPFWTPGRETAPGSLATPDGWRIGYVATDGVREYHDPDDGLVARCKSPLHMPRWASRITLDVVAVRVERLQSITEDDAIAEGAREFLGLPSRHPYGEDPRWSMGDTTSTDECLGTARFAFGNAWDKINGKRATWASNPWVWVVEFQRVGAP